MAGTKGTILGRRSHNRTPAGTPILKERRAAARIRGEATFDPGVECVRAHQSPRWTNSGICVLCKRENDNAYNAAHPAEHLARTRRSVARRQDAVRAYRKTYYATHAEIAKRRAREWGRQHPERVRERARAWHAKHRARLNVKASVRRAANPGPARAAHRRWKAANPDKVKAQDSLRRARLLKAATGHRAAYVAFLRWARTAQSVRCYWCRKPTRRADRQVDHIIPLAKGGADGVGNLCVACRRCNQTKNAKLPEDFAGQSEMAFT